MEYRPKDWNPTLRVDTTEWSTAPQIIEMERLLAKKELILYEAGADAMGEHILSLLKEKAPSSVIIDILSGYECKR